MKRFALLSLGLCLISLGSGCCCHNPCGPAGCGVGATGYPAGVAYGTYGAQSAALPMTTVTTAVPATGTATAYSRATLMPIPTYQ